MSRAQGRPGRRVAWTLVTAGGGRRDGRGTGDRPCRERERERRLEKTMLLVLLQFSKSYAGPALRRHLVDIIIKDDGFLS